MRESRNFAIPDRQLVKVYGRKFKPHPACDPGQTSAVHITHSALYRCIRKGMLDQLFSFGVNGLLYVCLSDQICQIRQIKKNNPSFTNDDSLRKMLHLASRRIVKCWYDRICRLTGWSLRMLLSTILDVVKKACTEFSVRPGQNSPFYGAEKLIF